MKNYFLTEDKKEELQKELHERKTTIRPEILERLAFAKSLGDLSENAEYHSSKDEQGKNEARINQIEAILKDATTVEANTDGTISIGSKVTLKKENKDNQVSYYIVDPEEADFSQKKISYDSPLGKALMGMTYGDQATVSTPNGTTIYTIISVD